MKTDCRTRWQDMESYNHIYIRVRLDIYTNIYLYNVTIDADKIVGWNINTTPRLNIPHHSLKNWGMSNCVKNEQTGVARTPMSFNQCSRTKMMNVVSF